MSTWILLRGLTREKRHWLGFPQVLLEELPEARVIELELPGNGELNRMTSPTAIAAMAAHCRAELARLGVPPPYHLLALSMGAMVATAWAAGHPDEVAACVLVNTSFGAFSPVHRRFRPRAWGALLRFLFTRSARGRETIIFQLTSRFAGPPEPLIDAWVAIRRSRPVSPWNAIRQLQAAARSTHAVRKRLPTAGTAPSGSTRPPATTCPSMTGPGSQGRFMPGWLGWAVRTTYLRRSY